MIRPGNDEGQCQGYNGNQRHGHLFDACKLGFEGIVCKRLGSRYRRGEGLKIKSPGVRAVKGEIEDDWGARRAGGEAEPSTEKAPDPRWPGLRARRKFASEHEGVIREVVG